MSCSLVSPGITEILASPSKISLFVVNLIAFGLGVVSGRTLIKDHSSINNIISMLTENESRRKLFQRLFVPESVYEDIMKDVSNKLFKATTYLFSYRFGFSFFICKSLTVLLIRIFSLGFIFSLFAFTICFLCHRLTSFQR